MTTSTTSAPAGASAGYHHGDLHNAMVEAATELARVGGPQAVTIREVARRVGVSHNAAYRHFTNIEELLESVAYRAMDELAAAVDSSMAEVAPTSDRKVRAYTRLRASGVGYIRFALTQPGLFRAGFADMDDPELDAKCQAPGSAYHTLVTCVGEMADAGLVDPAKKEDFVLAAWSLVHGLANLAIDGPLRSMSTDEVVDAFDRSIGALGDGF